MPNNNEWIEFIEQAASDNADFSENQSLSKILEHLKGDLGSKRLTSGEIGTVATGLIQTSISSSEETSENQDED